MFLAMREVQSRRAAIGRSGPVRFTLQFGARRYASARLPSGSNSRKCGSPLKTNNLTSVARSSFSPLGCAGDPIGCRASNRSDRSFSTTVHLNGRLDHESVAVLDSELDQLAHQPVDVLVFDLADLEYISSAGLRSIFAAQKVMAERSGRIVLLNAQPPVQKVFEIVKAADLAAVFAASRNSTAISTPCSDGSAAASSNKSSVRLVLRSSGGWPQLVPRPHHRQLVPTRELNRPSTGLVEHAVPRQGCPLRHKLGRCPELDEKGVPGMI